MFIYLIFCDCVEGSTVKEFYLVKEHPLHFITRIEIYIVCNEQFIILTKCMPFTTKFVIQFGSIYNKLSMSKSIIVKYFEKTIYHMYFDEIGILIKI